VHRIARAVSAILLLSILQVVGAPILAPQLTTPIASAADANDLPTGLGTVYQFLAESYTSGSTTWPEATGGAGATISASALKVTNTAGTLGANKSVVAVQGSFQTSITFPATVAYGNATNPNDYTFFHVARYAPQQTGLTNANYCDTSANHVTNNSAKKNRIFSSTANNWLSGFWACSAGVAYHMGWLTQSTSAVSELSGNSGNNWLLSADCGYVASSTSGCNGRYRAFGTDRTTTPSTSVVGHSVIVNGGQFPLEVSDFQIAEVISYPTILSIADIVKVETYLARKYGITLSSTAATKLGIHRASVGTTLNEPLRVQPQVAIQDSNGQTVTTDNSTLITATVTGVNGRIIGTATADAVQGIATFDNLGLDGVPGNSYTITYSSNAGLASTSESRVFSRGGGSDTDTALTLNATAGLNQYAEVVDYTGSLVDITGNVTLEAWVFPTSACAGDQAVISKFDSYMLYCGGGVWKYVFDSDGANWAGSSSSIAVRQNQWQHVAYVKSGTTLTIYIDGQAIATFAGQSASLTANNGAFSIGRYGSSNYFQGRIDEVRIYNAARSQAQVQSDMHNYGTITDSDLRAYFDFNEGSGSTLFNRDAGAVASDDLTLYGTSLPTREPIQSISASGPYTVVTFKRSILTSSGGWKVPARAESASALIVGGGGGGGSRIGGGGGGGGYVLLNRVGFSPGAFESITVGSGGFGARAFTDPNDYAQGLNGQESKIGSRFVAVGGGGGGGYLQSPAGQFNGRSGGSGGGASPGATTGSSGSVGPSTQNSGYGYGQGNSGGLGYRSATGGRDSAGGGGGAGGAGGSTTGDHQKGVGGAGLIDPLGGTLTCFSSGGGGGIGNLNTQSVDGAQDIQNSAGTCAGGTTTASAGTKGKTVPKSASPNSGSGGGGAGFVTSDVANVAGGNGGSGIIIIRWITASVPSYTKPTNAFLNVGMTETFTTNVAVDSATAVLTRTFLWESSTAGAAGPFTRIKSGTGASNASFSWVPSDTSTSGSNYLYRLTVTDSDTAGLFITDSSTAFAVINPALRVSGISAIPKAINLSKSETFTITLGTSTYRPTLSPVIPGITLDTSTAGFAVIKISETMTVGTYYETLTVIDSVSASVVLPLTIRVQAPPQLTNTSEIVADGQVFNLDFSNSASFSPLSQALADISGAKKTITAPNGGTYSDDFSGIYTLSATSSQYLTATAFSMLPKWTIETYIRINQTPTAQFCPFASEYASSSISMLLCIDAARTVFTGFFDRVGGLDKWSFKRSQEKIPLNTWVHIVGTFDGSAANLYFDGISTTPNSADGGRYDAGYVPPTPNTNRVFIGKDYPTAVGTTPNLSLGIVRAYSSGFTQTQVQQNYNATKTRFETLNQSQIKPTQKYGSLTLESFTATSGPDTKTVVISDGNQAGISWDTASTPGVIKLSVQESLTVGTYYDTVTVTDNLGQSTYLPLKFTVTKADTITVTMNSPSALNYTGATASFTPSVSFSGLKSTDTATALSVTITQTRSGATCAMGGTCAIGDRGPGGGIVFITPSTVSGNGRFFEAAPDAWYGANDLSTVGKFCTAASNRDNTNEGATQFGIGWGETNTAIFRVNCTGGAVKLATDYRGGGFSNWFVPNKNELAEMAKIPSTVDLINVTNYWGYWSSTEDGSGPASTMSSLTSSSWTMGAVSKSESTRNMVRPVRMFTACHSVDSCTAYSSTTMPTNAGTYRLTPSALTLSSGSLSNYEGVTYAAGLLTINKVNQTPIQIGQYDAFPGISTYPLNVYGGTGTGVMRRTLTSAGTANCTLTNMMFINSTSPGKCDVRVTKAADFNYFMETATATIYWIPFINRYTNSGPTTPTDLGLSGSTGFEKRTYETFTVLSFANGSGTAVTSAAKNTVMRVIGTGFDANDSTTEVIIGFFSIPRSSLTFNTTNPLANFVEFTLPNSSDLDTGANDVAMKSRKGWAFAPSLLNVTG
jgi:hypothetical protein